MKNKTFKRLICFLLALVVMVSLPLDLQANAVAIELGWMTWVLVSAMTAMGFTFAASGGIEALQSAVEDAVDEYDEYRETIGFNRGLYENLDDKLLFGGGGGQGPNLGNRFFLTAGAVAAIADFIDWVRSNKWFAGEDVTDNLNYRYVNLKVNEEVIPFYVSLSDPISDNINYRELVQIQSTLTQSDTFNWSRSYSSWEFHFDDSWNFMTVDNEIRVNSSTSLSNYGYYPSDVVCVVVVYNNGNYGYYYLLNDNRLVYALNMGNVSTSGWGEGLSSVSSSIVSPSTVTEFDVQENQVLELDFSVFENQEFNSPEEMADAIKNNIVDTGTVPNVSPSVVADPSTLPLPTPVPTPVPSPEIEDIDDLGLPTLGEAIFNKFPFSLPKDLKRIADILNADPVTPFWEVNLFETLGNRVPFVDDTTIRIDLAEYEALGQISRWASVITFVIFLVIITKGVIRW